MTVNIPNEVVDEIEEKKDRERIAWRRCSRMARDLARESEVESGEGSTDYPVVKATMDLGHLDLAGEGRKRYVRLMFNLFLN